MFPSKPLGELTLPLLPLLHLRPLLLGTVLWFPALVLVTNLRECKIEEYAREYCDFWVESEY